MSIVPVRIRLFFDRIAHALCDADEFALSTVAVIIAAIERKSDSNKDRST